MFNREHSNTWKNTNDTKKCFRQCCMKSTGTYTVPMSNFEMYCEAHITIF